jgi:hypothetical protein
LHAPTVRDADIELRPSVRKSDSGFEMLERQSRRVSESMLTSHDCEVALSREKWPVSETSQDRRFALSTLQVEVSRHVHEAR